jgi:hypothetical protein
MSSNEIAAAANWLARCDVRQGEKSAQFAVSAWAIANAADRIDYQMLATLLVRRLPAPG